MSRRPESTGADGLWCRNLCKSFPGGVCAVENLELDVAEGEFVTLLGPSGSGKTTALRMLIGLERPTRGEVGLGAVVLSSSSTGRWIPPNDRNFGMVFQSYAVWPHMTVGENIAFPLQVRKRSRTEIREAVDRSLQLIGMTQYRDRSVTKLSGGQQQRVAIARAIAYGSPVLLLDEPLSNLDVWLRRQLRDELKDLQRKLGVTTVYVTHDQSEAYALSDRIALMHDARLEQLASPQELYSAPRTVFAARFVGSSNLVRGVSDGSGSTAVETSDGARMLATQRRARSGSVVLAIKPEYARVLPADDATGNSLPCRVTGLTYGGDRWEVRCEVGQTPYRTLQPDIDHLTIGERGVIHLPAETLVPVEEPPADSSATVVECRVSDVAVPVA